MKETGSGCFTCILGKDVALHSKKALKEPQSLQMEMGFTLLFFSLPPLTLHISAFAFSAWIYSIEKLFSLDW
jgi:hypothetical protein